MKGNECFSNTNSSAAFFLKILFIYLFLERERTGEKHQCVVASHAPPTGDLAHNPGMCPKVGIKQATLQFPGQCSTH